MLFFLFFGGGGVHLICLTEQTLCIWVIVVCLRKRALQICSNVLRLSNSVIYFLKPKHIIKNLSFIFFLTIDKILEDLFMIVIYFILSIGHYWIRQQILSIKTLSIYPIKYLYSRFLPRFQYALLFYSKGTGYNANVSSWGMSDRY